MEDEVGRLLQHALSSDSSRAATVSSTASSPTLRAGSDALVQQLRGVSPRGAPSARWAMVRQSAGAKRERPRMADRPCGTHPQQQRVTVAVVTQLLHCEGVARRRTLPPELLPRAAPEPSLTRLARQPLGLGVHPREHQDATAVGVLHDRRAQVRLRHGASPPATAAPRAARRAGSGRRGESMRAAPPVLGRARRLHAASFQPLPQRSPAGRLRLQLAPSARESSHPVSVA